MKHLNTPTLGDLIDNLAFAKYQLPKMKKIRKKINSSFFLHI